MDVNRLFSLLKPPEVLSKETQQAYQEKLDRANQDRAMIKDNVVNPFFAFADKSFKKIMEVMNPGESYVSPALKKIGVNPIVAGGIGLGIDVLAPGPGEWGRVAKVGKEVKAGSELLQEAKKYKSAEEFVKGQGEQVFHGRDVSSEVSKSFGMRKRLAGFDDISQENIFSKEGGLSVSSDINTANRYAKETSSYIENGKPVVDEFFIDKNAKVASIGDLPKDIQYSLKIREGRVSSSINQRIFKWANENNYDAVDLRGVNKFKGGDYDLEKEIRIFNPNILKTKSQLTEIWNKAQIDERLAPLANEDGTVTVYRASAKFPKDKFAEGTFFATNPDNARYYAESWHKGDPSDIKIKEYKIPANLLKRGGSSDAWQLKTEWNKKTK